MAIMVGLAVLVSEQILMGHHIMIHLHNKQYHMTKTP